MSLTDQINESLLTCTISELPSNINTMIVLCVKIALTLSASKLGYFKQFF